MTQLPAIQFLLAAENPLEHVVDHPILRAGNWWLLTNHMVMIFIAAGLMLLIFPRLLRQYQDGKTVPTGSGNFLETIMIYFRDNVAKSVLGDETDRFMPLIWTLFFFIWFCNLLGLIPFDAIENLIFPHLKHPVAGTATGNFYVTATLALIVFVIIHYNGLKENGLKGWLHHFLGGAPWYLCVVMVPVEILGTLIKPFALAVRLAANMTAGHILLAVIIGFVPSVYRAYGAGAGFGVGVVSVISSVGILLLELFVATLQAYLFTFLSALFISQMLIHHHDDEHNEKEGGTFAEPHATREGDAFHKPAGQH
ncbi:MAG TPA: F0F1 ATP synthase subunit A [Humisphaera sp.]|nr:F0F1 ATP synthase subunit A [Humisphaera sp.]